MKEELKKEYEKRTLECLSSNMSALKMINFLNQKDGIAKTTSCANIGASLDNHGKTVLLVNPNAQGSQRDQSDRDVFPEKTLRDKD